MVVYIKNKKNINVQSDLKNHMSPILISVALHQWMSLIITQQ